MRRLKPADDPLKTLAGPIEDEFDRVHMLGGSPGGRAAATDKFGELCTQCGVQVLDKSYGDAPAFAWCQAQSHIRADDELHAAADHFTIAAGMGRPVVPPGRRVAAFPGRWRSVNGARRSTARCVGCGLRGRLRHGVLLAQVHSPSQQRDFCPDGSKSAVTDGFLTLGVSPPRPSTAPADANASDAPRLGAEVRAWRERDGWSLEKLARRIRFLRHTSARSNSLRHLFLSRSWRQQVGGPCNEKLQAGGELIALMPTVVCEQAAGRRSERLRSPRVRTSCSSRYPPSRSELSPGQQANRERATVTMAESMSLDMSWPVDRCRCPA